MNQAQLNKQYETFAQAANCTSLECLRKAPLSRLQLAAKQSFEIAYIQGDYAYGLCYWGPAVDGHIIQEGPLEAFSHGQFQKVPVLIDHDCNEGFSFSNTSITTTDEMLLDLERAWPNETFLADALSLYPPSTYNASVIEALTAIQALRAATGSNISFSDAFAQGEAFFGDALINCPTEYMALAESSAGLPTYKMIFDAGPQFHGATGSYLFSDNISSECDDQIYEYQMGVHLPLSHMHSFGRIPIWSHHRPGKCHSSRDDERLLYILCCYSRSQRAHLIPDRQTPMAGV